MAKAAVATIATDASVDAFLAGVEPPGRQEDARRLTALMASWTGARPTMWGASIIGFGRHGYRYDSGREGEICAVGFAPRKAQTVLYGLQVYGSIAGADAEPLLARLGKHTAGKGCIYLKRLSDVDEGVLEEIVRTAFTARHNDGAPRQGA